MGYELTESDWLLAAPFLWLAGALVALLTADALRPSRRAEAVIGLLGLLGATWSLWPLAEAGGEPLAAVQDGSVEAFSGMLLATPGTAVLAILCLGASAFAGVLSLRGLCLSEGGRHSAAFWALLLVTPAGMILTLWASHMASLLLGIETLSLPLYVLAALRRDDAQSVEAGLKYFLLGAFASGFLAFGMALLYAGTGELDLSAVQKASEAGGLAVVGLGMMLVALLFKLAAVPFHLWVADVYQGAPTSVTALMAAGTKAAAAVAVLRWAPNATLLSAEAWAMLGCVTLLIANFSALNQSNLKRLLALSGVAHVGILLLAFAAGAAGGAVDATVHFYLVAYGVSALAAFGALELLERRTGGSSEARALQGLARRQPLAGGVLCVAILSLAGIPLTVGFLAKYFVFVEMLRVDLQGFALIGILLTIWSFAYYLRALVVLFMKEPEADRAHTGAPEDPLAGVALCVPAILALLFGVWPSALHLL